MASASPLSSVSFAPVTSRPWYDPSLGVESEPEDRVCVVSVGPPFQYVIPSFDVLQVEMRQLRVKGYTNEGEEKQYDFFIRSNPALCRPLPAWIIIKDCTFVKVRSA